MTALSDAPRQSLLRFLTCGSVDDGKSTLIGRLLYDHDLIFDDQMESLERDSRRHGTTGADIDFALLVDGLEAEREQGITIDVAYRFFSTKTRHFIVADTPGHEQYSRNMATGASTADLAIILIDARKGVLTQTRRHSLICAILGIRQVLVAVNKIDLVDYSQSLFDQIVGDYRAFAADLGFTSIAAVPISARFGDNVARRSDHTPWYSGPILLDHLNNADAGPSRQTLPFRFPVQWVNRPDQTFRGYSGDIVSGSIRVGDPVIAAVSGKATSIARIVTYDGDQSEAHAGDAITLTLTEDIDLARGDMLVTPRDRPEVSEQFAAKLLWMHEEPLLPGRTYLMRIGTRWLPARVTSLRHRIDVNSGDALAARTLSLNEIGLCHFSADSPIAFDPYGQNRETGAFILVDRFTHATAGAGMIDFGLRRATNVHRQDLTVTKAARADVKGHRGRVLWFTGLSGSGKSTIANALELQLNARGLHTYVLDGDNLRHGLNRDLGFTDADRVENIRRVGEVAKLFVEAGLIVLCAFISPFRAERAMARDLVEPGEFIEIFVDTPLEDCIARDPKGLYARAKAGLIKNFTGLDSPYEAPEAADIVIKASGHSVDDLADWLLAQLDAKGLL